MSNDNVNVQLEAMLPELDDLVQKGLFTKLEVKTIVKKRREHEFALAKRIANKADFLRYAEYETKLEQLRKKRKERILAALAATDGETGRKKQRPTWKGSVSDHSLRQRIHFIYDRALRKFPGDVDLWIKYLDWAESVGANKVLGRSYARAIQLHPSKPTFWIKAATWELESNTNMGAARVLLQRAIRMNPDLSELWHEYFKLELAYLEKVRTRREILFGKKAGATAAAKKQGEEDEDDEGNEDKMDEDEDDDGVIKLPGDDQQTNGEEANKEEGSSANPAATMTEQAFFDGAIPKVVYKNAIRAIPKDLDFRARFLELYHSAALDSGVEQVLDSIRADFGSDPAGVEVLASSVLLETPADDPSFPGKLRDAVKVFQDALADTPSPLFYSRFADFLRRMRKATHETNLVRYLNLMLLRTLKAAETAGMLDEKGFCDWSEDAAVLKEGSEKAEQVLERGLKALPGSIALWKAKLGLELSRGEPKEWRTAFKTAVKNVDRAASWPLWEAYLDALTSADDVDEDIIAEAFKQACGRDGLQNTPSENAAIFRYLDWVSEKSGIQAVREAIDGLIKAKVRGPEFYERCISLELLPSGGADEEEEEDSQDGHVGVSPLDRAFDWKSALFVGDGKPDLPRLRRYFEAAVEAKRKSNAAWLSYVKFELAVGKNVAKATAIYDRAGKAVADRDGLDQAYMAVKTSLM